MPRHLISIVIPVLNEANNLERLVARLMLLDGLADLEWELVFVDDGSTDGTLVKLRELNRADGRVKSISFSRNFGGDRAGRRPAIRRR